MAGSDRVRYCGQCRLNVYNLSAMSAQDARNLIAKHEGRLCVRFYQRRDGTVLTKDCPVGLKVVMRRLARVAGIAFSALVNVMPATAQSFRAVQSQTATAESGIDLRVVDPQGAVIQGARMEILRGGQRVGNVLSTDNEGALHIGHLAAGIYAVKISLPNFEPHEGTVTLKSGVRTSVQVTLQVAAVQGEVTRPVTELIEVIQSESPLLAPVPVPELKPRRRGFFRGWVGWLGRGRA